MTPLLTASQVNKAGRMIRKLFEGTANPSREQIRDAIEVLVAFRAAHSTPLVTANNGLRSMVRSEGCADVKVSQRLKRVPTIIDKLQREPTLPLAKMQDIGGVRAVLNSIDEIRRVEGRLKKRRPVVRYNDYIAQPRLSGYRGVHVVVEYGERNIEVQLRTPVMHDWAVTVERISGNSGENYKQDGDHPVQEFLAVASQAMALEEEGRTVDASLLEEYDRRREQALPYLTARRNRG